MQGKPAFLALTTLSLAFFLGSCAEPEAAITIIDATEDIEEDTTWSGQVNVTGEISIEDDSVLTIEPGTTVLFAEGAGLEIFYGSSISAIGTADRRITFSCANEGDQWMGIAFDDETIGIEFAYCDFSDAGYENTYAIGLDDDSVITVRYCDFDGNHAGGLNTGYPASGTAIRHCSFGDNGDSAGGPYDVVYDSHTCVYEDNSADNVLNVALDP